MEKMIVNDCLTAALIVQEGVYKGSDGKTYVVEGISPTTVTFRRLLKSGHRGKARHSGIYGVNVFFTERVDTPAKVLPQTTDKETWTTQGRTFYKNDVPMFTMTRLDGLSPTEADTLCRKLCVIQNALDKI